MDAARARAATAAGCAAALLVLASAGPTAATGLLTGPPGADPTSALVGAAGLAAWGLVVWLLLTAAVTSSGHLPGRLGRTAAALSRRIAPVAVRRAVEVALGLSVTTAVLGGANPAAASAPSLDWGAQPGASAPSLDWGSAPAPPAAVPPPAAGAASPTAVVVAPGDSLWSLAERDLAQRSGATPSDAAVAQAWPAWWAANRAAVGDDPHLIQPGTPLTPPASR